MSSSKVVVVHSSTRLCPNCDLPLVVRTSRTCADGKNRVRHVVCKKCGHKEKIVVKLR